MFLNIWRFFESFCSQNLLCSGRIVFCMLVLHFQFLTQADHFAKDIAFAWAIVFETWPIFKIVSFPEYFVFFRAVFAENYSYVLVDLFFACFWHF